MELSNYIIDKSESNLTALKKIDNNKKGFLIVVDGKKVVGTITDGDLRRAFIDGKRIEDNIYENCQREFKYVQKTNFFENVINYFKNQSVEFLPILNENQELVNIVTKKQMHCLLLQDEQINYDFQYQDIDESLIDYEIYERPWGFYKTTVLNNFFQSKVISIFPDESLSLQLHHHREEHWVVVHGSGEVTIGDSVKNVNGGDYLFIPKGCKHRMKNNSLTENLIIMEVQIGDYFGEDDIVRFEDNYGRA